MIIYLDKTMKSFFYLNGKAQVTPAFVSVAMYSQTA